MHVVIVSGREVEVNHVSDSSDVEASGGNVRSCQHLGVVALEKVEGSLSLRLAFISVDRFGFDAPGVQLAGELLDTVLGTAENEDFGELLLYEEFMEDINFGLAGRDPYDILVHVFGSVLCFNRDAYRRAQELVD